MTGFLTGVAANIVLGQLPQLLGVPAQGDTAIAKAFDVRDGTGGDRAGVALTGFAALAILLIAARTRAGGVRGAPRARRPHGRAGHARGRRRAARVDDIGEIPSGLPLPALPARRPALGRSGRGRAGDRRDRAGARRRRTRGRAETPTARRPASTATSSPRASATSPAACSRASPSAARSGRPR